MGTGEAALSRLFGEMEERLAQRVQTDIAPLTTGMSQLLEWTTRIEARQQELQKSMEERMKSLEDQMAKREKEALATKFSATEIAKGSKRSSSSSGGNLGRCCVTAAPPSADRSNSRLREIGNPT